jgi:uncharacterized protein
MSQNSFDSSPLLMNNQDMIKFEKLPPEIMSKIPAVQDELMQSPDVVFAYIFGGLARGQVKPLSDVDIAVYLNISHEIAEHKLELFDRVTEALGTSELDLVILNDASISIAGRILQDNQLIVDKEPYRRHAYESLIRREFFDFRIKEDAFFKLRYGIG